MSPILQMNNDPQRGQALFSCWEFEEYFMRQSMDDLRFKEIKDRHIPKM